MRTPTFLILASLCLFGTLAFAQDPADFFDYEEELRLQDSLYENNPDISSEEVRQAMERYHQNQADAYYQAYRQRIDQQEKAKELSSVLSQSQAVAQVASANNTTSEGLVPDAVEHAALVALYNATEGANWTHNDNWLQGTTSVDLDNWFGVNMVGGDVHSIVLNSNNLKGPLPPEIGSLSGLRYFYIHYNEINSIPPEIKDLDGLTILLLHKNLITDIPSQIGDLDNLRQLDLSHNQITALPTEIGDLDLLVLLSLIKNQLTTIPSSIANLTNLRYLNIQYNQLNELPTEIRYLGDLIDLRAHYNQLTSIPIEIGNLLSLENLSLEGNHLTNLPNEIGNLSNLKSISIRENQIASLPAEIGGWNNLKTLSASYNKFTNIPSEIGDMDSIVKLFLHGNQITNLPDEIGKLTGLETLWIQENQLTELPSEIGNLANLTSFYANHNQIDSIPFEVSNFANLEQLSLDNNQISYLPAGINTINSLSYLSIHKNRINVNEIAELHTGPDTYPFSVFIYSGQVKTIGKAQTYNITEEESVTLTAFTNNHPQTRFQWYRMDGVGWTELDGQTDETYTILNASLPDAGQYRCRIKNDWARSLTQYSAPITLVVEEAPEEDPDTEALHTFVSTIGNLGNLPASWNTSQPISTWEGVSVINGRVAEITLKNKGLTGSIPESFNKLTELKKLNLSGNKLSGPIPESLSELTQLTDLILFDNQLSGAIPTKLGSMASLKNLRLATNQLTGSIPAELGDLLNLRNLFLNNNQLTGSIPPSLGRLHQLERLNLGINQLSGIIPPEIGSMASLQYLYLQKNQLNGTIPDALGNLFQLKKLVAFNNQFEGRIPETFLRLQNLDELQLYRNRLTYAPDFSSLLKLNRLDLRFNYLTFNSLLYNRLINGFKYAPQLKIGPPRTVTWNDCSDASIDLGFDYGITNSLYRWKRNNQDFRTGSSSFFKFSIQDLLQHNRSGNYTVSITNPLLPDLTLSTERITLDYDRNIQLTNCPLEPHNYVKVETVLKDGKKDEFSLSNLGNRDLNVHYDYIDGLGRTIQQVDQAASPAGKDVIQPIVYDALGRVSKSYLPYVTNNTNGDYRTDAVAQVTDFYAANDDQIANTTFPYAETIYEASPLSRVTEQGSVGEAWQVATPGAASNKTIKMTHRTNSEDEVKRLVLLASGEMKHEGYYAVGQLYVNQTKDELNRAVWDYQDKRGQTVLKRVEGDGSTREAGPLDTYYLYDDFGNLRVVVPPKLAAGIGSSAVSASLLAEGAYVYTYDHRQRMISQQVPGADPVWMVYDQGDRLVLTQDGNQRQIREWSFTKYDPLNRPILTGLFTTTGTLSREQMQDKVKNQHTTERYRGQQNNAPFGYSDALYPKSTDGTVAVLTATYYDRYDFVSDLHGGNSYDFVDVSGTDPAADYPSTYFPRVQGQVTGTQVRVLGSDDWRWEAVYYDEDYRVIQTIGSHYPQGADRYTTRYDDAGRATHTLRQHYGYAGSHQVDQVHHRYTYDHAGRPTAVYHRINNEAEVQLAANTYNELGELITQDLHRFQDDGYLQSVDYAYNERGWLTAINRTEDDETDDLFQLRLSYNDGPSPQYNGSITSALWVNQTQPLVKQEYEYTYDKVDRLAKANYHNYDQPGGQSYDVLGGASGNPITYDPSGNIRQLTRYGQQGVKIDELAYDYGSGVGNQLHRLTDGGNAQGFAAGEGGLDEDYYYDANGNLTDDYHKGITVRYNHLNLPEMIDFTASGAQIRYTYDAVGTRLMKEVDFDGVNQQTIYMNGIEYYSPNWQNTPESQRLLSYLGTDYGRVYPYFPLDTDPCATLSSQTTNEGRRWVYHYDLTDHLGNVRTTVASERTTDRYVATMESEVADSEGLMFRGLDSRHPDVLRNTTAVCDAIDNPNESAHLRVASDTDQRVFGPAKMLPVQPGDKIRLSVQAQYVPSTDNQTYSANLATLFLSAFTGGGPGAIESGSAAYQGLSEALKAGALLGRDEGDVPRAYLRYMLFDKNYQPVANFNDQNSMRISAAGANAAETLASGEISIDQPGYLYVYVSNESNWQTDVFFDDLVIEHERGTVVQAQDFYPFGMAHQPHTRYENKFLFQGAELTPDLGLQWYDFGLRGNYLPDLGRWGSSDPAADQYYGYSNYHFGGNNPLKNYEVDGAFFDDIFHNSFTDQTTVVQTSDPYDRYYVNGDFMGYSAPQSWQYSFPDAQVYSGYNALINTIAWENRRPSLDFSTASRHSMVSGGTGGLIKEVGKAWATLNGFNQYPSNEPISHYGGGAPSIGFKGLPKGLIGLSDDAAKITTSNVGRVDHAARHLHQVGMNLGGNPGSKMARSRFKSIAQGILTSPLKTFDHTMTRGGLRVKGFLGVVDGQKVIILLAKEPRGKIKAGDIVTSFIPTSSQIKNLGL